MCGRACCSCVYLYTEVLLQQPGCGANEALRILPLVHWFIEKVRTPRGTENRKLERLKKKKQTHDYSRYAIHKDVSSPIFSDSFPICRNCTFIFRNQSPVSLVCVEEQLNCVVH